jgi:ribose transport system ATP-binding protein
MSISSNIELASLNDMSTGPWLRRRRGTRIVERFFKELRIKAASPSLPVGALSGGNQQKVALAKVLATKPRVLLLDEPTRGIDVGAHAEIIQLIRSLCAQGMALLVVSSELEEIVAYADEVIVLRDRAHVARLRGEAISVPAIMAAIAGHAQQAA